MLVAALSFLTPRAALLAPVALVPVAAFVSAARRVERVRTLLRLPAPRAARGRERAVLLAAVVLLLVVAAMQPVVRTQTRLRARTDAQVFVVLDTSRSMAAAPSPGGPSRLERARRVATALGTRLHGVPLGVATFTDRVLPDLFPTSDMGAYDSVVQSLAVDSPPPRDVNTVATTFDALTQTATEGFFAPAAPRRAAVVITDGESRPFDPATIADSLQSRRIALAVVRVGDARDRVWDGNRAEANFRPDTAAARLNVARLLEAVGTAAGADPAAAVARAVGRGPTGVVGVEPRDRALAPILVVLALVPLAVLLGSIVSVRWLRRVTFSTRGPGRGATT
jgi:von Willebrand factor type A domain